MLVRIMSGDENMSEQECFCACCSSAKLCGKIKCSQEKQLRDCFAKFDSNGDGKIQVDSALT